MLKNWSYVAEQLSAAPRRNLYYSGVRHDVTDNWGILLDLSYALHAEVIHEN